MTEIRYETNAETTWESRFRRLLGREGINKNEYYMMRVGKCWFGFEETAQMMISSSLADYLFTLTLTGGRRVLIGVMDRNRPIRKIDGICVYPTDEIILNHSISNNELAALQQMTQYKPEDMEYIQMLIQHLSKPGINND
ncbi:MAG: hypothetical protein LBR46_02180 [Prevotella sp.]|jgi:hypothetical protein|nr:hypothetical protein [Prevotella sp.]